MALSEVVVTAQKRAENLQNVPIAITALSSEDAQKAGINSVETLEMAVPGLSFAQVVGYALPRIRGIGTGAAGPGVESSVAFYVDNVYIASPFAAMMSFNNIAQTAVLKGPQGTLFGRNATGGVIQVTTLDPGQQAVLNAAATYGNYATRGGNLYAAAPLTGQLAADVAVYYNDRVDGFGRNLVTGHEVGSDNEIAVRTKVKWDPTDTTTLRLGADYERSDADLIVLHIAKGTLPIDGIPYTGPDFSEATPTDPHQYVDGRGLSLQLDQQMGDLSLVSISAYRQASIREHFDSDAQPAPLTDVFLAERDWQFTQELQLLSPKTGRLTWVLGAFYFDGVGQYPYQEAIVRSPPFLAPPTTVLNSATEGTKSYAGFGQATFALTDDTNLTGGLRYTADTKDMNNTHTVTLPNGVTLPTALATGDATFDKTTFRAALDHRFSEELLGYASFNRGFKSGLFDPLVQPKSKILPEVLDAYELGLKSDWFDRRMQVDVAVFHYNYANIQIAHVVNGVILLLNGPKAETDGLDLDGKMRVTERLTLTVGLSAMNDRFTSFPGAVITTPLLTGGNAVSSGSAQGNRLPMTPDWTANAQVSYAVPTRVGDFELSGAFLHNSGYYEGPENRFSQPAFNLVNGALDWHPNDTWRASLWVKNAFDQFYSSQLSAQARGDSYVVGEPRTFGVTLGVKF